MLQTGNICTWYINKDVSSYCKKMTHQGLIYCIKHNNPNFDFDFDELGMTWQVSFVRLVGGDKNSYNSIEHFFFSLIKSGTNMTSSYIGQPEWKEKVNLIDWANGLKIEHVNNMDFNNELSSAYRELDEEEKNWEKTERINRSKINIPKDIVNCWSIEETKELRLPVGSTWSKIVETKEKYFYIERHWES